MHLEHPQDNHQMSPYTLMNPLSQSFRKGSGCSGQNVLGTDICGLQKPTKPTFILKIGLWTDDPNPQKV